MNKFFEVNAKCGHVGRNNFINISFPIIAENGKEAALICRNMGRVKHHRKDAINYVKNISKEEYENLEVKNQLDPYLQCKNIQMQNKIDGLKERICCDKIETRKKTRCVEYKIKKQKEMLKMALLEIRYFYKYKY